MNSILKKLSLSMILYGFFCTAAIAGMLQERVTTYNGPGNTWDEVNKIVVDEIGNIYVTGTSGGEISYWLDPGNDIVTIKFDPAGEKLWEARYNNPNFADGAAGIAVDQSGSVYITGHGARGRTGYFQYVTIKYNSDGKEEWVNRLTPSWHPSHYPVQIEVDSSGNIYVAGTSAYVEGGSASDIFTFKYNQAGTLQWAKAYDTSRWGYIGSEAATSMTIDSDGNVYIAGTTGNSNDRARNNYDSLLLKYDTNGALEWSKKYDGYAADCRFTAIDIDTSGNIYATGWSRIGDDYDYITASYDSSGNHRWTVSYYTPGGGTDVAKAIAADSDGNVYVAGYSGSDPTHYTTIKYDTYGNGLWVKEYKGPGSLGDVATSIGLADDGNVYVTGYSYGDGTGSDFATIKYSTDGIEEWVKRYNGSGNGDDYANALAIDKEGNVSVAGGSYGSETNLDYTIIKYFSATNVNVDIKPGSSPNSININSKGVIPVAVLSTDGFDATSIVTSTIKFGPNGANAVHDSFEDIDGDGSLDLIMHFAARESGIEKGDTSASMTGTTIEGESIIGSDSVKVVGR